jgi:hypothetical protein
MFEDLAAHIPEISTNAKYWFVRTNGGALYQAFIGTNSIAIGHQMVNLPLIEKLPEDDDFAKEDLKVILKKFYPPKLNAEGKNKTYPAFMLRKFCVSVEK